MAVAKVFRVNITISLVPRLGMRLYHNHMLKYFNDHSFIMSCICKLCAYCDQFTLCMLIMFWDTLNSVHSCSQFNLCTKCIAHCVLEHIQLATIFMPSVVYNQLHAFCMQFLFGTQMHDHFYAFMISCILHRAELWHTKLAVPSCTMTP